MNTCPPPYTPCRPPRTSTSMGSENRGCILIDLFRAQKRTRDRAGFEPSTSSATRITPLIVWCSRPLSHHGSSSLDSFNLFAEKTMPNIVDWLKKSGMLVTVSKTEACLFETKKSEPKAVNVTERKYQLHQVLKYLASFLVQKKGFGTISKP